MSCTATGERARTRVGACCVVIVDALGMLISAEVGTVRTGFSPFISTADSNYSLYVPDTDSISLIRWGSHPEIVWSTDFEQSFRTILLSSDGMHSALLDERGSRPGLDGIGLILLDRFGKEVRRWRIGELADPSGMSDFPSNYEWLLEAHWARDESALELLTAHPTVPWPNCKKPFQGCDHVLEDNVLIIEPRCLAYEPWERILISVETGAEIERVRLDAPPPDGIDDPEPPRAIAVSEQVASGGEAP